ncbi:DUF1343 domain-containing protein [soil metagenome]
MISRHTLGRLTLAALIAAAATAAATAACRAGPSGEARATESPAADTTPPRVSLGITTLLADSLHLIRGKRVGLITNHTGRDEHGTSTIDILHRAPEVQLTALFSPEHGIRGAAAAGERVASGTDSATGVPIHSLYGDTRVPGPRTLENVDVLLYDIQDVGARMYTYVWTMTLAAEAAKRSGRKLIVLDRPNPIRADIIEGGFIEQRYRSFTGLHNVTLRYGLTPGELALYLAGTGQIDADIAVAPMKGYRLSMWWDETRLEWRNPSPNIRDPDAALLYPGTSFFEATNLSEGRGTEAPFKLIGAPWLTDAGVIARALNNKRLPGVRFDSTSRTIGAGQKHAGRTIPMIRITVTARDSVRAADVGAHMLREILRRHQSDWRWREQGIERLSGTRELRAAVQNGGIEALLEKWRGEASRFESQIAGYRLYPR